MRDLSQLRGSRSRAAHVNARAPVCADVIEVEGSRCEMHKQRSYCPIHVTDSQTGASGFYTDISIERHVPSKITKDDDYQKTQLETAVWHAAHAIASALNSMSDEWIERQIMVDRRDSPHPSHIVFHGREEH
jgi:hypothetical protein